MAGILREILRITHRVIELIVSGVLWLMYRGGGKKMPAIENLLLLDSASVLAFKIRTGKVSSVEVVELFISRIKEVNPVLNCVVDERFEEALKEAKQVDELIRSNIKTVEEIARDTPFLGVPFTTKDSIKVKGLSHTAGLYKRKDIKADKDAVVVSLMRKAGAIPLAVTNISELCMWWESSNTVYGRTNNPYNTNHIVGGSSGGEGCIQAAAASAFGIGSDIGGSIRMPAFFNGIFGHKPSRDIVSNDGQYPFPTGEQETYLGVGPMCRFASDLAPMLRILADKNASKLHLDEKVDIQKIKYFYMENDGGSVLVSPVHPEIRTAMRKVVAHFEKAYGIKPQKILNKKFSKSAPIWFAKMKVKGAPSFSEQLTNLEGSVNVYLEFLKWILCWSNHTFIGLCTALTEMWGVKHGSEKHQYLVNMCSQLKLELQDMLGTDGVLLYPTHPTPAPYHNEPVIKPFNFSYTGIINVLGLPATNCPLGLSENGLPLGIQVIANQNQDHLTLAVACELEKAFGGWVPPAIAV
ncbi:fatty-acid amide hydrolase 2 [Anabrus simplex]|uniref:fatty-acid amide hydrolase 2 n=1 Tax=Anabrus simplex TaxID=316456 RepID=UPI0035A3207E